MSYSIPAEADKFGNEWKKVINSCRSYRTKAKGWGVNFDGRLVLHFKSQSDQRDDLFVKLDLYDGKCREIESSRQMPGEYGFVYRGSFEDYRQLLTGYSKRSLMDRTFELEGDLKTFVEYAPANHDLASCAQRVDVSFKNEGGK